MDKEPTCSAGGTGDWGSIPGLGRSTGEGNSNTLQYSCLENPMDRGAGGLQSRGLQRVRHDLATNTWGINSTVSRRRISMICCPRGLSTSYVRT